MEERLEKQAPSANREDIGKIRNALTTPLDLSFGQKLVGLTFNPAGDEKVLRAKLLCAELADLINETPQEGQDEYLFRLIRDNAFNEILNAQMNVVKLLTLKY